MTDRVLVAGVGNIFLGDDGFGVEVASRLARRPLPDGVKVADFGIRGVHLAYELLDGYDCLVLLDAVGRGDAPATLSVLEPELAGVPAGAGGGEDLMDAHKMPPESVLRLLSGLGGSLPKVIVVGCEPAVIGEQLGLSDEVAGAVEPAVEIVVDLLADLLADLPRSTREECER